MVLPPPGPCAALHGVLGRNPRHRHSGAVSGTASAQCPIFHVSFSLFPGLLVVWSLLRLTAAGTALPGIGEGVGTGDGMVCGPGTAQGRGTAGGEARGVAERLRAGWWGGRDEGEGSMVWHGPCSSEEDTIAAANNFEAKGQKRRCCVNTIRPPVKTTGRSADVRSVLALTVRCCSAYFAHRCAPCCLPKLL